MGRQLITVSLLYEDKTGFASCLFEVNCLAAVLIIGAINFPDVSLFACGVQRTFYNDCNNVIEVIFC